MGATNCTDLSCLRTMTGTSLKDAAQRAMDKAYHDDDYAYGLFYWGPTLDGTIIRDYPLNEFQNGHFTKVPLMVDHDSFEAYYFLNASVQTDQEVRQTLRKLWPTSNDSYIDEVFQQYPSSTYNATIMEGLTIIDELEKATGMNITLGDAYSRMHAIFGDVTTNCATSYIAEAVTRTGLTAYKSEQAALPLRLHPHLLMPFFFKKNPVLTGFQVTNYEPTLVLFDAGSKVHGASLGYLYSENINRKSSRSRPVKVIADRESSRWSNDCRPCCHIRERNAGEVHAGLPGILHAAS